MKAGRQRRIVGVLKEMPVTSQSELVKQLRLSGYPVTQATVSRDLEELGAVKVRRNGRVVYALPNESPELPPSDALGRMFGESVLDLESTGNMVVVKTPPGHGGMVGGALDRMAIDGVAGTVAGDDTILVVCRAGVHPHKVERHIRSVVEALPDVDPGEA